MTITFKFYMYVIHTCVGSVEPVLLAALLLFVHMHYRWNIGRTEPEFVNLSRSPEIDF